MVIRWAFLTILSAAILSAATPAVDDLATLQARFDKETDGERKVKLLAKLADAQVAAEREASQADDFKSTAMIFEKYRDNIRDAFNSLRHKHPNAVKKSGGYKRLEFENQRALREVNEVLLIAPDVFKPPLQLVQSDLLKIEDDLLHALFPDRPGEKPLPPKTEKPPAPPEEKKP
jgi:hypothetical protein